MGGQVYVSVAARMHCGRRHLLPSPPKMCGGQGEGGPGTTPPPPPPPPSRFAQSPLGVYPHAGPSYSPLTLLEPSLPPLIPHPTTRAAISAPPRSLSLSPRTPPITSPSPRHSE
ncbi:hypothetical protein E2C01_076261 [Portunus trituberculatus]|uniref:Uncharacterized protein n=1 Tax=Portunus trituberculatus TaxID=210409 RepID=A0A5B7IH95_PORTR|nr:hypothetical protein [Portunus trituberculatus]